MAMAEAECHFEKGKLFLELGEQDRAISAFYESIAIFDERIGRRNKTNALSHALLGKCHVLKGESEIGSKILVENHVHLEAVFGIVSLEAAENLKLIGGIQLSLNNTAKAYKRFKQSYEIFYAINPKHKQVNHIVILSYSVLTKRVQNLLKNAKRVKLPMTLL